MKINSNFFFFWVIHWTQLLFRYAVTDKPRKLAVKNVSPNADSFCPLFYLQKIEIIKKQGPFMMCHKTPVLLYKFQNFYNFSIES